MSCLINDTETIIMYAANNDNDIVRIYICLHIYGMVPFPTYIR